MAERAGFSERHLTRLFADHLDVTPAQYVEQVRVEAARSVLERGDDGLEVVARHCGFRTTETMRRAFVRHVGVSPGTYRDRFRTTGIGLKSIAASQSGVRTQAAARQAPIPSQISR
jgi:transcriptional regulator GlxA family with amidase domain